MTGSIKINGNCEMVRIVSIPAFTYEGAVDAYKKCVKMIYENLTVEGSAVLSEAALQLNKLGFTWDEIEKFEIEAIS